MNCHFRQVSQAEDEEKTVLQVHNCTFHLRKQ